MAVGFGFSVGDLFAGLKLIKDSIEAVHDTKGSPADYLSLVREIICLQDGLKQVEEIQSEHSLSETQHAALERAAYACQESIDVFLSSISKYQSHLNADASGIRSGLRKIKWALCKKEDVAKFRSQLQWHASSINLLLVTFQARQNLQSTKIESSTAVNIPREDYHISEALKGLSLEQRQIFIAMTLQNRQLVQSIEELRKTLQVQATIPPQVLLQQPVVFLDPFGKTAPFHMEFIDSLDCFMAVLKARFQSAGVTSAGLSKLENHDFLIQDSRRRWPIDLKRHWSSVFQPGQYVDMSMVFHRFACLPNTCPTCWKVNKDDHEQIHCQSCGLYYQNVQGSSKGDWNQEFPDSDIRVTGADIPYLVRQPGKEPEIRVFRPMEGSEDELFEGYRRVQLVSQSLDLLDARYPALQLIEDFCRFARLLQDVPDDASAYLPDILILHRRSVQHVTKQRESFPAFASFSQVEEAREYLAQESIALRRDIDKLIQNMYKDPDTKLLMSSVKENHPSNRGKDYYTGVLTRLSDFTKSGSTKVRSAERMQWLLFDGRPK